MSTDAARRDFPMLKQKMHGKPLIYLDSAATALKPLEVIKAMEDFLSNSYGTVHRAIYQLSVEATAHYQEVREKAQRFLNAPSAEEIIFTRGATESINLVAHSFGKAFVAPGDQIIISEIEHHSNIVPWQFLCEERGAELKVIPVNDRGELDMEAFRKLLNAKTRLVAVAQMSNALGTLHPIKEIASLTHAAGAKLLVDGAQAAPRLPVDLQELDADFYVCAGHKMYGPTGIGLLYGKKELLEAMPPYQGGGDMIKEVTFAKTSYAPLPMKFEAGTPMIAEVVGLGAAIDYLNQQGMEQIEKHEQELLAAATAALEKIPGLKVIGTARKKGAILSFVIEGIHPLDIGTMLDLKGIAIRTGHHCAQPTMRRFGVEGTARLSFGLYNTLEEVESAAGALREITHLFTGR